MTITTYQYALSDSEPVAICSSPYLELWVADFNNAIWSVSLSGEGTSFTAAQTPTAICYGPDGNLWATATGQGAILQITPDGNITSFAMVDFSTPEGICVGPDENLWACGRYTSSPSHLFPLGYVWKITTAGSITPYEIDAVPNASLPTAICQLDGNLWVADNFGFVWKVTTAGDATSYPLPGASPYAICVGPDGNLWVADGNGFVWVVATSGVVLATYTLAGSSPFGICAAAGMLWVADGNGFVWSVTIEGLATSYALAGSSPNAVCMGPDGDIWVADDNSSVWRLVPNATGSAAWTVQMTNQWTVASRGTGSDVTTAAFLLFQDDTGHLLLQDQTDFLLQSLTDLGAAVLSWTVSITNVWTVPYSGRP